jgi:hypothetical protein
MATSKPAWKAGLIGLKLHTSIKPSSPIVIWEQAKLLVEKSLISLISLIVEVVGVAVGANPFAEGLVIAARVTDTLKLLLVRISPSRYSFSHSIVGSANVMLAAS